jgi:hypothetical protein
MSDGDDDDLSRTDSVDDRVGIPGDDRLADLIGHRKAAAPIEAASR